QAQAVCGELRELGVDATVLRGGLRHWRDQGRPLVGGADAIAALNDLSAKDFMEAFNFNGWVLVDMSADGVFAKSVPAPDDVLRHDAVFHQPYEGDPNRFAEKLIHLANDVRSRPGLAGSPLTLVLADRDGGAYAEVKTQLKVSNDLGNLDVLFVTDGLVALQEYNRNHALMWARLKNPPIRRGCNG
ncbi:hypothetical protein ACFL2V_10550, partial [Pseudomonadota bacterium]